MLKRGGLLKVVVKRSFCLLSFETSANILQTNLDAVNHCDSWGVSLHMGGITMPQSVHLMKTCSCELCVSYAMLPRPGHDSRGGITW